MILQQHTERTLTRSVGDYNQFEILQKHKREPSPGQLVITTSLRSCRSTKRTLTRSVGDYNQFTILQKNAERTLTRSVGDYN
jgi:hypothetical protein